MPFIEKKVSKCSFILRPTYDHSIRVTMHAYTNFKCEGILKLFRISFLLSPKVGASIVNTKALNPAFSALCTNSSVNTLS